MQWNRIEDWVKSSKFSYHEDYLENANRILNDEFVFQHVYNMEPTPESYKLTSWHESPNGDPEWLFVLKRQEYLQDLIYSFLESNNEKYLVKAKELMLGWIDNNYDSQDYRYSSWRTIDTGIRLLNWATAYNLLVKNSLLSDSDKNTFKMIVNDQAQYLKDNYIEKYDLSNWGILITSGVLVFGATNENILTDDIMNWAFKKFQAELIVQVDNEGMHWEQSPLYFIEVFRSSLCVYSAYKDNQFTFVDRLTDILKSMLEALTFQILPSGNLLQQGDTDSVPVQDLISAADLILNGIDDGLDKDFLTMEFHIPEKMINKPVSNNNIRYFDAQVSGNYFIDDRINKDYLHLFNGNLGSGHGHASDGHLDLSINGENILIDPGRFTYVNSDIRRSLKSADSHNVIMLDNKYPIDVKDSWKFDGVSTPLASSVIHTEKYDAYKLVYSDPNNNFYITRYVIWIKNKESTIVFDVVNSQGKHTLKNNWVFGPDILIDTEENDYRLISKNGNVFIFNTEKRNDITISDQIYSPRYNEKFNVQKIESRRSFENIDVNYSIFGNENVLSVNDVAVKQADSDDDVKPEYCKAIEIQYDSESIIIALQHLNTYIGNKLYYAYGVPIYGELNIIDKETHRLF